MNNMNECSFVLFSFSRVGINDEKKKGVQNPLNTLNCLSFVCLIQSDKAMISPVEQESS